MSFSYRATGFVLIIASSASVAKAGTTPYTFVAMTSASSLPVTPFIFRYNGSLPVFGTSEYQYNLYPGGIEIAFGTPSSPNTTSGAPFKVSRTGAPRASNCVNEEDSECSTAASFNATGLSNDTMQVTALLAEANGSATTAGTDVLGLWSSGRVVGSGVGIGTGAYIEGRRDTTTGKLLGAEVRSWNVTSSNCFYNTIGIGDCDGLWLTSYGNGVQNTTLSSALHVAAVTPGIDEWNAALTINANSVVTYGIDDESSAINGYYDNGLHTYAAVYGRNAGKVGIGTLAPSYQLDTRISTSGAVASFTNSSGSCTHTPGASSETVSCSSDRRLKTDIRDSGSALEFFRGIRVREFKVKATGEHKTGVIAQEMLENYPETVHSGEDGYLTVDEPDLWQIVKAIQELDKQQRELQARGHGRDDPLLGRVQHRECLRDDLVLWATSSDRRRQRTP
jgi:hypothetical protein